MVLELQILLHFLPGFGRELNILLLNFTRALVQYSRRVGRGVGIDHADAGHGCGLDILRLLVGRVHVSQVVVFGFLLVGDFCGDYSSLVNVRKVYFQKHEARHLRIGFQ